MFWSKKYKCEKCGEEYRGTEYGGYDNNGNPTILCKNCFNEFEEEIRQEPEKQEQEFNNFIRDLIKQSLNGSVVIDNESNKRLFEFETEFYCKTKLTKKEIEDLEESAKKGLAMASINKNFKIGEFMYSQKNILPPINLDKIKGDKEKILNHYFNQKPKKVIYYKIIIKSKKEID
ncbi:MAG: hypothetical protein AABW67_00010 [Nanoarchaeota archaeon]